MSSTQISIIFFVVGIIAVTPVLYYHYRKNPHPRFRPPLGEMVMLSLFALIFVGGGSYFMGTLLTSDPKFDENSLKRPGSRPAQQQESGPQGGGSAPPKKESRNPFAR